MAPSSVALDFEKAEWNAFEKVFGGIEIRPCFFHLQKSVVRNVSTNGNKELYDNSDEFRREVNPILATAFIPTDHVSNAFINLRHYLEDSIIADQLEPILDYFEDCYLGRPTGDKRRKPRYPIDKWNVVDLVKREEPRTNNSIESFNGQLISTLAENHPTIRKLIDRFRNEFRITLSYCLFGTEEQNKFVRARIAAYLSTHMKDKWLLNFFDTNESTKNHIGNILIPAKSSSETHKYCQNVDFAAAAKDFGFNVLLFSDIGCSIYSPALNESLIITQDVSLLSFPIVFAGGNYFEVALNVSAK